MKITSTDANVIRTLGQAAKRAPLIGPTLAAVRRAMLRLTFDSGQYWDQRYRMGGTSGPGSYGRLAQFKAEVLNGIVLEYGIQSLIEFGCGDGNQLSLGEYPEYVGLDISPFAIEACQQRFRSDVNKRFILYEPDTYQSIEKADAALSLDVIFHLTEDHIFNTYMRHLFAAATHLVIIYSDDVDGRAGDAVHVRHRKFSKWIRESRPDWQLTKHIPSRYPPGRDSLIDGDVSWADFWIFKRARAI